MSASGDASLAASGCPAARSCAAVAWSADLALTAGGKAALSFGGAGLALGNSGVAPPELTALGAVTVADTASLGP